MLTLLTLNNGVFPVTVQRSYVQLRDWSTVPVQRGPRVGQVDWSEPLFFLYSLIIFMGYSDREKPTYTDEFGTCNVPVNRKQGNQANFISNFNLKAAGKDLKT